MSDLFLSDDPPPRRARPRWVDGLGLAAVVLGIVAIGALGDRGSPDRSPAPTTTTSTTSPFRRGTPYSSTTTTEPLPTTTTQPVRFDPGLAEPTGTLLLLEGADQRWRLVDVDHGLVRTVSLPSGYAVVGTRAGLLVAAPQELHLVRFGETTVSIVRPLADREHTLVAAGLDRAWLTAQDGVEVVTGELSADGTDTGRLLRLPPQAWVAAGLEDGVVVSQAGALTAVPLTGRPRSLGSGYVLGDGAGTIVRSSCAVLRCRLELVDTRTAATRAITGLPEPQAGVGGPGVTSADGRWVATTMFDATTGYGQLVAIDLRSGRGRVLARGATGLAAFAYQGTRLFAVVEGQLRAFDVATGHWVELSVPDVGPTSRLVAAPVPVP